MDYKIIEYVWIGGAGELRSKSRVLDRHAHTLDKIPTWNYDGSSTGQATGDSSEIVLVPRKLYRCPFRKANGMIAICDAYTINNEPAIYNHRAAAEIIFKKHEAEKAWYGLEQEYFIYDKNTQKPLGFDKHKKQGQYYCSVGGQNAFGRSISDLHLEYCLHAGIKIAGTNAEVAPGQWEFQIGPVEGIEAADQLWVARYILEKISENYNAYIVYDPKPLKGDWNGSGCHTNFSTLAMRNPNGYNYIRQAIEELNLRHNEHMAVYGSNNKKRMSGHHETSRYDLFTFGVGSRNVSVRIPNETFKNKCGYFEDRRPAANMDPYQVCSKILETSMANTVKLC